VHLKRRIRPQNIPEKQKSLTNIVFIRLFKTNCGLDETRTRDPLRDRQVF
jgi:hypothetical protein